MILPWMLASIRKGSFSWYFNSIGTKLILIKPGIGGEILPGQKFKQHSVYPAGEGEAAPAWLAFDRQVLSFDAYFHESVVPTISREGFRIRPVKVFFYLEDDSIQVIEPTLDNSGIPQGTHINLKLWWILSRYSYTPTPSPLTTTWRCSILLLWKLQHRPGARVLWQGVSPDKCRQIYSQFFDENGRQSRRTVKYTRRSPCDNSSQNDWRNEATATNRKNWYTSTISSLWQARTSGKGWKFWLFLNYKTYDSFGLNQAYGINWSFKVQLLLRWWRWMPWNDSTLLFIGWYSWNSWSHETKFWPRCSSSIRQKS